MSLPTFSIKWIQNLSIYQTATRVIIVGSNNAETRFRILQVDRTSQSSLKVYNDENDYDKFEFQEKLTLLLAKYTSSKDKKKDVYRPKKAHGIVGFVKFLFGYYLIVITKRSKVAELGGNSIYKIEETSMIYVPNVDHVSPEENRYLKIFQAVDLSSNFYYSSSYDLSNTLQHNMLKLKLSRRFTTHSHQQKLNCNVTAEQREMASLTGILSQYELKKKWRSSTDESCAVCGPTKKESSTNDSEAAEGRFLWNEYLQEGMKTNRVNWLWCLDVIHGYINQSCLNLFGERIYITLIARRSNKFAGPRFMKRGCNLKGDVANEVETEQIVHCASMTSMHYSPYTSYVQHRGSVPIHWMQDITANVVPAKPPITMTSDNSYAQATSKHMEEMMKRYGTPISILNLVKKRDKRANESSLGNEFKVAIEYLNQFVKTKHQIKYQALDMSHILRGTKIDVVARLAGVAENSLHGTGFFQSKPDLVIQDGRKDDPKWRKVGGELVGGYRIQTGVLRTNCVDCLDRTNSAQFVAGKCALAYQLFSLGVIDKLEVQFDTDVIRLFEEMFEEHGDIIALQYGGSLLVHTIQSYRRLGNPWSSHSRDIVTTLSRYYSNTFSDADKQSAINLFLGVYRHSAVAATTTSSPHLWEITTDEYLHNDEETALESLTCHTYTKWLQPELASLLPLPLSVARMRQKFDSKILANGGAAATGEAPESFRCLDCSDWYEDFHRLDELTSFDECFSIKIPSTATICTSAGYLDTNPFTVRTKERSGDNDRFESKSLHKYTNNNNDEDDDDDSDDYISSDEDSFVLIADDAAGGNNHEATQVAPWLAIPQLEDFSAKAVYGIDLKVDSEDIELYRRHVESRNFTSNFQELKEGELMREPMLDAASRKLYEDCVSLNFKVDRQFYQEYFNKNSLDDDC